MEGVSSPYKLMLEIVSIDNLLPNYFKEEYIIIDVLNPGLTEIVRLNFFWNFFVSLLFQNS